MWEFDRFYVLLPNGAGYYRWIGDPAVPDAINHTHALGAALAELYRFTKDPRYLARASELMAYFRASVRVNSDGAATWEYQPRPTLRRTVKALTPEVFWKAAVTIEFPLALWRAQALVTRNEMEQIAYLFSRSTFVHPDRISLNAASPAHRKAKFDLPLDRTDLPVFELGLSLLGFATCALFLNDFDPAIDAQVSAYVTRHPARFEDGLFSGPRAGVMARAYSFYRGLSI